jgi:hypothetical protein
MTIQMTSEETAANVSARLEYPACPLCRSEQRQFPFRLHRPYNVARCTACGFHYLYPRLIETAMQEVYRQSSYYEGGACGYADTIAVTWRKKPSPCSHFQGMRHNFAKSWIRLFDWLWELPWPRTASLNIGRGIAVRGNER